MLEKALQHNPAEVLLCLMLSVSLPFRDLDATSGPATLLWWQHPELTLGFLCLLPIHLGKERVGTHQGASTSSCPSTGEDSLAKNSLAKSPKPPLVPPFDVLP